MGFDDTLDDHGQPLNRAFNAKRIRDRGVDELLGLCKGMIADDVVNEAEARFLLEWLEANQCVANEWPGNVLYARIYDFLRDGKLDAHEQAELMELLTRYSGHVPGACGTVQTSTALPFDDPQPALEFDAHIFVLTGKFAYGTRAECTEAIHDLGGWVRPTVLMDTHYVVVGTLASRDWVHANYGRKIETALQWRQKGKPVRIISEDHWAESIIYGC